MKTTRTLLAGSIVGAAVLALTSTTSATTAVSTASAGALICTAVPDGATFITTGAHGATVDRAGSSEALSLPIASQLNKAVRGPDGTVWVEASGERGTEIHRISAEGTATIIDIGDFRLQSAGWLDGRSAAVVIDTSETRRPDEPDYTGAVLVEYSDGTSADVGAAGAPEFGVSTVGIGAGRIAEGAWSDLTESFAYYDATGAELTDWFDPTTNATYNGPPLFQAPVAANLATAPSGVALSWVEGPDIDGATNVVTGGWTLVVADAVSGTESFRLDLGDAGEHLVSADFDGRFWVGTFDTTPAASPEEEDFAPGRVLAVDTASDAPAAVDAGCPAGVTVTLDRMGTPEPEAPAPTTTTTVPPAPTPTTAAPNTTAPATCPSYAESPNTYPVKLCQTGSAVRNVQVELVQNGYDVEIDGYFGPNTQAAVRAFQSDHGLEVDGLVGPDTWARLIGDDFLGTDADGNDTVDPWEIVYDDPNESDQWEQYIGLVYTSSPPDFGIIDSRRERQFPDFQLGPA